jgi:hypothetical protein
MSTQNAPAVKTKFGNRLRAIATDLVNHELASKRGEPETFAEVFALRIRHIADDIDAEHTETLAQVHDISRTLHAITAVASACGYCGSYIDAGYVACPRCGWKVGA